MRSMQARDGAGDFVIDPDEQVQSVVRLIFEQFAQARQRERHAAVAGATTT